jgi:segregation and condensation protein A
LENEAIIDDIIELTQEDESTGYTIKIENFEGPLDLLFHLIEKNKFNIYDIPINLITDQYMEYLFAMEKFDMDIAGEFLVMAATLLHIKSRMMLPVEKKEETGEEDDIDPREELVMRLMEYKIHKEFSGELRARNDAWKNVYYKFPEIHKKAVKNDNVIPERLFERIAEVIRMFNDKDNKVVYEKMEAIVMREKVSLKVKIRQIITELKKKVTFKFQELFSKDTNSKSEIVVGFMAILELARNRKVGLKQKNMFGDIVVSRTKETEQD